MGLYFITITQSTHMCNWTFSVTIRHCIRVNNGSAIKKNWVAWNKCIYSSESVYQQHVNFLARLIFLKYYETSNLHAACIYKCMFLIFLLTQELMGYQHVPTRNCWQKFYERIGCSMATWSVTRKLWRILYCFIITSTPAWRQRLPC